jgi:hypothetical protein
MKGSGMARGEEMPAYRTITKGRRHWERELACFAVDTGLQRPPVPDLPGVPME